MMSCPTFVDSIIFADNAKLGARLSSIMGQTGKYLPLSDGPRMQRPDRNLEVLRRHNLVGRTRAKEVYFAGLSTAAKLALKESLSERKNLVFYDIVDDADVDSIRARISTSGNETFIWGNDRVGVGLLLALRSGKEIVFKNEPSPDHISTPALNGHLVVCEEGEELAQVIAANYAWALGAGLFLIPSIDKDRSTELLDSFYRLYDHDTDTSPSEAQARLSQELLSLCGSLPMRDDGSLTFIGKLPYGFAYPEYPSTHLFDYPDLGCSVVNGLAAEQPNAPGVGVAILVDPGTTPAPEIDAAQAKLFARGAFIRIYQKHAANVRDVSDMMEHFPYDLLIIATHCGDSDGFRWTFEFTDNEGKSREFVTDVAAGFARTDDPEIVRVQEYMRFVSIDGIDWADQQGKERIHAGLALRRFYELRRQREIEPTRRETVERVVGSAALKMADHNLLFAQHTMAAVGTPIVINNACASWHQLAGTMTYAGARAYLGTLFPVTPFEASAVVTDLIEEHWGDDLPVAVWKAQRNIYGSGQRRPYVMAGVFPQRLRTSIRNYPAQIRKALVSAHAGYQELGRKTTGDPQRKQAIDEIVKYYEKELSHFARVGSDK